MSKTIYNMKNTTLPTVGLDSQILHATPSILSTCNDITMPIQTKSVMWQHQTPRVWSVEFRLRAFANSLAPTWLILLLRRSNTNSELLAPTPSQNTENAFSMSPNSFHSSVKLYKHTQLVLNILTDLYHYSKYSYYHYIHEAFV